MIRLRSVLKNWFSRGKRPTEEQFADLIDSFYHKTEDALNIKDVHGLSEALGDKLDKKHSHGIGEVDSLPETLDGFSEALVGLSEAVKSKANMEHTHDVSEIQGLFTVDVELEANSENPVQNQAVTKALGNKSEKGHTHQISEIEGLSEALGKSAAYITKTWRSGYSWYRVYSDGWVEQGGRNAISENATITVNLHKKMKDTSYQVMVTNNCTHTAKDAEGVLTATSASVSQIKIHAGYINPNSTNVWWEVKGMMASAAS